MQEEVMRVALKEGSVLRVFDTGENGEGTHLGGGGYCRRVAMHQQKPCK
jgi:hypothetical protein